MHEGGADRDGEADHLSEDIAIGTQAPELVSRTQVEQGAGSAKVNT